MYYIDMTLRVFYLKIQVVNQIKSNRTPKLLDTVVLVLFTWEKVKRFDNKLSAFARTSKGLS